MLLLIDTWNRVDSIQKCDLWYSAWIKR